MRFKGTVGPFVRQAAGGKGRRAASDHPSDPRESHPSVENLCMTREYPVQRSTVGFFFTSIACGSAARPTVDAIFVRRFA
jgi:hypothetical protein